MLLLTALKRGSAFTGPIMRATRLSFPASASSSTPLSRLFTTSDNDDTRLYSTVNPPRSNGELADASISDEIDAVLQGKVLEEIEPPATLATNNFDKLDLSDPSHLSTMNPRWIKAGLDQKVIDVLSNKTITSFTPVQAEVRMTPTTIQSSVDFTEEHGH